MLLGPKQAAGTIADKGYINGYPDGTFGPTGYLTRAEAVSIINRILENENVIDSKASLQEDGDSLKNGIYVGGVEVAKSVGEGSVTIDDGMLLSTAQVLGGGADTVEVRDTFAAVMNVNKNGDDPVNIKMVGNTTIQRLNLFGNAILSESNLTGSGVVDAYITGNEKTETFEVSGEIEHLTIDRVCTVTVKDGGSIELVTINVDGVKLYVEDGGYVGTVEANGDTKLKDAEPVGHLIVNNGSDNTYQTEPDKITINDGTAEPEEEESGLSGGGSSGGGGGGGGGSTSTSLAAPKDFQLTHEGQGQYTFGWGNVEHAAEYTVTIKNGSTTVAESFTVAVPATGTPSFDLDEKLGALPEDATNYTVTVTAKAAAGSKYKDKSANATVKLLAAPDVTLTGNSGIDTAALSWGAVPNADDYLLLYQVAGSGDTMTEVTIPEGALTIALKDYLTQEDTSYVLRLVATSDAEMTLSNSWSATVTRRANSDQISNLRLVEDAGVYSIAWDGVAGSGGYIIHVNDGTIIPDVEVAEGTTTYAVPNTWLENGNLTVAVSAKNQDSTADMVIGGGAIAPAQHGFNAPAAPNSPQAIADTVNPYQITWNGVSFADGGYEALITDGTNSYPVTLSGKLDDGITDKVTSVNNGGITKYTANLAKDFANLPLGTYTLQIRSAGLTALSDGKNYTIPSTYATVKAADGSGSDQTYELSQLEQPKGFQIAEVTGGEQLTWGAVTNATGYELSLTEPDADTKEGDNTYAGLDAALIFNATNTPAPKADPADPDVCILDTVGAHDVWVRATSTDPKVTNSEWAKVTIDRLAAPGFSVDETANMGLNQAFESTVILTLTPVTNQTGLSLVDANGAVTLDDQNQVDVSASFQLTGDARATGITIPYTYRALGDEGTAKAVDAGGTLYLGSLPATQNVQRLAQPTGFTLAPEYSSVVAPFDTDAAKLGASERTYVVTWPQVKSTATTNANYGYKLTCELFPLDDAYSSIAASDADTGSWTVPQTWRNTNSAYTTLVIAAQQGLADFALQSYPTQITFDTATINTLLKPAAPTYTFANNTYTINWAATTGVSFYDLLITYTDADGNVTDVTPATGFQGIEANDAAARVKDITAVITEDVGTYNVYVRSTDRIGTGEANIGSDWSEPLAITNNQLAQVTDLQANQTIDTTAGSPTFGQETVTLTWTNSTSTPAAPVTYQLYVKDTAATDYTDADGNTYRLIDANATSGIDITTVVQDPTVLEYSFIVVATTTDAAWLDSEATQVKVTRQAQPGLSMADNGSGVAVLTISAAALEPELYVDETQKAVAYDANIKTATYEATEMTDGVTLNLAVIIPSAEVNNLASIVKTQTAQRLATPDTATFALNYANGTDYTDGYTLAWDAITNATGYKVIHGMQNDDVTNVDTNAFAIPGNWIDNPASYQLTVTAVGDAGQFIMNSTASSLYSFQTLAAPVNPVLAADGTLTWTGSPAAKYSIVSIQKDGVDIAVDPAYTGITGALDNSTDLLPVIQTNGSGKYVVTLRSDDNFATKVLGSAPVATAADAASGTEFKIAKAPDMATEVVGTPAGATVVLQWPVAGYVNGYTVTIDGDTATNAVTISGGIATLTLADTDFDAYDTEYPLVITAIPEAGAFAGDPTSSTIKRVSPVDGSSFQIVVGSVYLVWNAVATDDVVDYYSITRADGAQQVATDSAGNAYEVKVASDVMKGDGTPLAPQPNSA